MSDQPTPNDIAHRLTKPMRLALKRLHALAPARDQPIHYCCFNKCTADALVDRNLAWWSRNAEGEFVIWITPLGRQVAGQIGTIGNVIASTPNHQQPKGEF